MPQKKSQPKPNKVDIQVEVVNLVEIKKQKEEQGIEFTYHKNKREVKKQFLRWWMADIDTRQPKTFSQVAELLRWKQHDIHAWMRDDQFWNWYNKERKDRARAEGHLIDKALIKKAKEGVVPAIVKYYDIFGVKSKEKKKDPFGDVDEKKFEEAKEIATTKDNPDGTNRLTDEEDDTKDRLMENQDYESQKI